MGQVFGADNIPDLVIASSTTITMATSYQGKSTRIAIGGQAYRYTSAITINFATTGINALDTGAIAANTLYYIYAVVVAGTPGLVASTSSSGPTGYTAYKEIGRCRTLLSAATLAAIANRDNGVARISNYVFETASSFALKGDVSDPTPGGSPLYYRRTMIQRGGFARIRWEYSHGTAGTAGSGNYYLLMPSNMTVDQSLIIVGSSGYQGVTGDGFFTSTTPVYFRLQPYVSSAFNDRILSLAGNEAVSPSAGWGSSFGPFSGPNAVFSMEVLIPIAEWQGVYT